MEFTASPLWRAGITCALAAAAVTVAAVSVAGGAPVKWGAISISTINGTAAASWNYNSQADAESAANASCDKALPQKPSSGSSGGTIHDCATKVDFYSGYCGSVAQASDGSWSWAWARNLAEADSGAIGAATGPHPVVINHACQK